MINEEVKNLSNEYIANTYSRFDVAIESGNGVFCKDFDGKEYLDFTSGIGVNSLGFCDSRWAEAVIKQVRTLNHTSNLYYTLPGARLAAKLCLKSGMKKVFFSNSGAEANECAIKAARKYSFDKYGSGRHEIITLENSFHGRTLATLSATGQDVFHKFFDPFVEGFVYTKANDAQELLSKISEKTCAIMLEVIQGEGGVLELHSAFLDEIVDVAQKKDILIIVDEVQTGIGRCGTLFGYQGFQFLPNIVSCAKGLAGGLPLGATLFDEKTAAVLSAGSHATTFGANPIICSAAEAVLDSLNQEALLDIMQKGIYMRVEIAKMPHVLSVNGQGLMLGVALDVDNKSVVEKCLQAGLLVLTAKEKLRLLPPLNITIEEIKSGLEILEKVLKNIE